MNDPLNVLIVGAGTGKRDWLDPARARAPMWHRA
jgi:hypothetical protein